MKLSKQATGALLMTLQKCLSEQVDITELLNDWILEERDGEIFVLNPPFVKNNLDDSLNASKSEILIP
jgi:hypothetical protein